MILDLIEESVRVLREEAQALNACADRLMAGESSQEWEKAIFFFKKTLDDGGKIVVTGVGKSGKIAQKISATLSSTGSLSVYLHPTEALHGDLGVVCQKDIVLALSYTGNTDEVIQLLPSLQKLGVPIIGMGGNTRSLLSQHSEAWIDASVVAEVGPYRLAPTTSTTLALALGDAIAMTLMRLRGFDPEVFAQNHPGGSLGKQLHLRVRDLMHQGKSVAFVQVHTPVKEVIMALTEKKLGAVLVVNHLELESDQQLLGLITEGDLRRALQRSDEFFKLFAGDIMTKKPVTIRADALAKEALDLMEKRSSQISVLPVIHSEKKQGLGLIRLHDLVRVF